MIGFTHILIYRSLSAFSLLEALIAFARVSLVWQLESDNFLLSFFSYSQILVPFMYAYLSLASFCPNSPFSNIFLFHYTMLNQLRIHLTVWVLQFDPFAKYTPYLPLICGQFFLLFALNTLFFFIKSTPSAHLHLYFTYQILWNTAYFHKISFSVVKILLLNYCLAEVYPSDRRFILMQKMP